MRLTHKGRATIDAGVKVLFNFKYYYLRFAEPLRLKLNNETICFMNSFLVSLQLEDNKQTSLWKLDAKLIKLNLFFMVTSVN